MVSNFETIPAQEEQVPALGAGTKPKLDQLN